MFIVSCSWDLLCKTYDEEDPEFFRALRVMDGHEHDVTCVAYSDTAGLLLTGSVDFKNNNVSQPLFLSTSPKFLCLLQSSSFIPPHSHSCSWPAQTNLAEQKFVLFYKQPHRVLLINSSLFIRSVCALDYFRMEVNLFVIIGMTASLTVCMVGPALGLGNSSARANSISSAFTRPCV